MFTWMTPGVLQRGILLFWALWLTLVCSTNVLDALRVLRLIPASFKWTSGNFAWINQTLDPLAVPRGLQAVLFAGAIGWELLAAVLFWAAFIAFRNRPLLRDAPTLAACAVNLALWGVFQMLDEVFFAYGPESVHRSIFANQLLTILVLYILSSGGEAAGRHTLESVDRMTSRDTVAAPAADQMAANHDESMTVPRPTPPQQTSP